MASRNRPSNAREAILDSARELIRESGVAGTSISGIVARSGTSAGAVYHHFGSKERLVLEVGRGILAEPMATIMATSEGLSPTRLLDAALAHVISDERTPELLLQFMAGARSNPVLAELVQAEATIMKDKVGAFVRGWCAQNAPEVDVAPLVEVLMGLVMGFALLRAVVPGADPRPYRELAVDLLGRYGLVDQPGR